MKPGVIKGLKIAVSVAAAVVPMAASYFEKKDADEKMNKKIAEAVANAVKNGEES